MSEAEGDGPLRWLSSRAGLIILVVLGVIIGLRLLSKWLKWLMIAVAVGALVYLIKSRLGDESSESNES